MRVLGEAGDYRLDSATRRLGGQAEVYRAVDPRGRVVAVKIARERGIDLHEERRAWAEIAGSDPHSRDWLVEVLDSGETEDGRPFVVMPWYERSFDAWLREERPALGALFVALERTAEAVVRLHRAPGRLDRVLVHRDIKPQNLLVDPMGRVLLADLGIVKTGELVAVTAQTGIGTPSFAPPEQGLPLERLPDPSVDVHALAATVFSALTGQRPRAVLSRAALYTDRAARLIDLTARGPRGAAEEAELATLRRLPLSEHFQLDAAVALLPGDEARLRDALAEGASETLDVEAAGRLADELAGLLLPALRRGLAADPEARDATADRLYAALRRARERLVREGLGDGGPRYARAEPRVGEGVVVTPEHTLLSGRAPRAARNGTAGAALRWGVPVFGCLSLAGAVGVVGLVWALWPTGSLPPAPGEDEPVVSPSTTLGPLAAASAGPARVDPPGTSGASPALPGGTPAATTVIARGNPPAARSIELRSSSSPAGSTDPSPPSSDALTRVGPSSTTGTQAIPEGLAGAPNESAASEVGRVSAPAPPVEGPVVTLHLRYGDFSETTAVVDDVRVTASGPAHTRAAALGAGTHRVRLSAAEAPERSLLVTVTAAEGGWRVQAFGAAPLDTVLPLGGSARLVVPE